MMIRKPGYYFDGEGIIQFDGRCWKSLKIHENRKKNQKYQQLEWITVGLSITTKYLETIGLKEFGIILILTSNLIFGQL